MTPSFLSIGIHQHVDLAVDLGRQLVGADVLLDLHQPAAAIPAHRVGGRPGSSLAVAPSTGE